MQHYYKQLQIQHPKRWNLSFFEIAPGDTYISRDIIYLTVTRTVTHQYNSANYDRETANNFIPTIFAKLVYFELYV